MKFSVKFIQRWILSLSIAFVIQSPARADPIPKGWQASNMKAVGYSGLDGRGGAFKMAIRQVAGRGISTWGTSGIAVGRSST